MEGYFLPMRLRKNTFDYTQILKGVRSFVYEQTHEQKTIGYEVFEKRISKQREFAGRIFPPKEMFPCNEDFGVWAWTFKTYDKAIERFNELENKTDGI